MVLVSTQEEPLVLLASLFVQLPTSVRDNELYLKAL